MAAMKSIIFAMLFTLCLVLAEDATTTSSSSGFMGIPGLPNPSFPTIPGLPNFSSGFPSIPNMPSLPGMSNFPFFSGGSRTRRQADEDEESSTPVNAHNPAHENEDRLFFTLFPSVTACNYTANPGLRCLSCTQALTCLPSNVGLLRNCRGLFPYCNNGRCSLFRGAACFATTSTSSTSTSTSTTTTTSTTPATGK